MQEEYKIVYKGSSGEITEKKSRFIATVMPVCSEEEALAFIESVKKKYWNASHNCFAYTAGEQNELKRFSDDGELGGTAGRPILDVLLKEGVHDAAVVVTRYFGGTLLGTGGLVRAYSQAAKAGLAASVIIAKQHGYRLHITTDYTGLGKIRYILGQKGIAAADSMYTDKVRLEVIVPLKQAEETEKDLIEGTNGQAVLERGDRCEFAVIDGEIKIL